MYSADRLPFDPGPAAWNELLENRTRYPDLEGQKTADVTIVGAGFAGISAARRLKQLDPNLSIILLEARTIGEGPAGRNSGFMIDLPHNLASKDYAGTKETDTAQTLANRRAISFAQDAAEEYQMPNEAFERCGKINAAATPKGDLHNHDYARHLTELNEPYKLLNAKDMKSICGSDYYSSGLFTPGTAMLQPALYVHEFAKGLTQNGIEIFENSAAMSIQKEGSAWSIETQKGQIKTGKIILGVNGHAESFGLYKRRLVHIYLYASMTAPLGKTQCANLGGERQWGLTPADPMGTTVRRISGSSGDRIIIRNSISWSPDRSTSNDKHLDFAKVHDQSFINRFPMLNDVKMAYRWGGLLCMSLNAAPAHGEIDNGLYSACCQNGLGTAIGTLSGIAAAERALGVKTDNTSFFDNQPQPKKLPLAPIAALGAKMTFRWGEFKAGKEL